MLDEMDGRAGREGWSFDPFSFVNISFSHLLRSGIHKIKFASITIQNTGNYWVVPYTDDGIDYFRCERGSDVGNIEEHDILCIDLNKHQNGLHRRTQRDTGSLSLSRTYPIPRLLKLYSQFISGCDQCFDGLNEIFIHRRPPNVELFFGIAVLMNDLHLLYNG